MIRMDERSLLLPLDFGLQQPTYPGTDTGSTPHLRPDLHQWFTPAWAAEEIVQRKFPELVSSSQAHRVLEPSCGDGRFLLALPDHVDALGVEIDPSLAHRARVASGRKVITGDFLTAAIPGRFTHAIGNPPFDAATIHGFLARIYAFLEEGGKCGLLLPAYVLQTSARVMELANKWTISQELVPRNLFPRLSLPLVYAMFRKERSRTLVGFFLYPEASDVSAMPRAIASTVREPGRGSIWRRAVRQAFQSLGVERASLEALYGVVERPTENRFWREKVRQTLQAYPEFLSERAGQWSLQPEIA
jgi:adenine-specific DNA-methyltransferase